jgi:hypothetical protein
MQETERRRGESQCVPGLFSWAETLGLSAAKFEIWFPLITGTSLLSRSWQDLGIDVGCCLVPIGIRFAPDKGGLPRGLP